MRHAELVAHRTRPAAEVYRCVGCKPRGACQIATNILAMILAD